MISKKSNRFSIMILTAVLIVVLSVLIFSGASRASLYEKAILDAEKKELSVLAHSNALRLQEYIRAKRSLLRILALNPEVQLLFKNNSVKPMMARETHDASHKQIHYILQDVKNILFTNTDGSYVGADELQCQKELLNVKRPEVTLCLELKTSHISDYFKTPDDKGAVTLCEPVYRDGVFVGVISLLVYMEDINEFLSHIEYEAQSYGFLSDQTGRLISHPNPKFVGRNIITEQAEFLKEKKGPLLNLANEMKTDKTGLVRYALWTGEEEDKCGFVEKIAAYHPVKFDGADKGWSLGVTVGYNDITGPIKQFQTFTIITVSCGILFLVIVFAYYVRVSCMQYVALQESQSLQQTIIDHIPHQIFWKDAKLAFLGGNKEFMENAGVASIDDLRGLDGDSLPCTADQALYSKECDEQVLRTGHDLCHYEEKLTNTHGNEEWFDTSKIAMRNSKGEIIGVLGIYEAITERRKVHEQLINLTEDVEQAYKVKSEFLANMSHEIRTPMNSIIGVSEFLFESELNDEQRNYVGIINKSADLLLDIMNSVLDYSKIESGKLKLVNTQFSMKECIKDTVKCFELSAESKNIQLAASVDDDVPDVVCGDHGKLRQVLVNLIGNALKFSKNGDVDVRVTLYDTIHELYTKHNSDSITLSDDTVAVCVSIQDNGIGISESEQHKIFDAFVQADGSASREHGGTGLGLSISSEMVKMMKGDIWLESIEGEGSTFYFVVQFGIVDDKLEVAVDRKPMGIPEKSLKILVVDDDPMNQVVVSTMLNNAGFTTNCADNGHAALLMYKESRYDLILMDLMMPVLNGLDATKAIRTVEVESGFEPTPIIAFSACTSGTDIDLCKAAGCDSHLSKPVRKDDLISEIRKFV